MKVAWALVFVAACGSSKAKPPDAKTADAPATIDAACTPVTTTPATQAPGSFAIVLDRAAHSNTNHGVIDAGIVDALDRTAFDNLTLGLTAFPRGRTNPPQCLCTFLSLDTATCNSTFSPGLACGQPTTLDVPLAPAGANRSTDASGPRHDIYQFLTATGPLDTTQDGAPGYAAMSAAYTAVAGENPARRVVALVSGGAFSCTSYSTRPAYNDGGGCNDWESPDSVNALATGATGTTTAVIGLPGTHSHGEVQGTFQTAPYSMELALSTLAVAGGTDASGCDRNATFSQAGADPTTACHIDLAGGALDAMTMSAAIRQMKERSLGCVYEATALGTIDYTKINIVTTIDGTDKPLSRRSSSAACTNGCWDVDAANRIAILGPACTAIDNASTAVVSVEVGCPTHYLPQ